MNWLQPNFMNFIIQLVDILIDPIFTEIEQSLGKASIGIKKGILSPVIFKSKIIDNQFVNDPLQAALVKLINSGHIQIGARSLYITDKGHDQIKKWVIPVQYKLLLDNIKDIFIKDYRSKESK